MTALICGLWIWSPVVRVWCWKTRFQSYLNFFFIFKTVVYINKKKFQKSNTETSYILIFGQIILSLPGILRFWLLNMTVVMTSFEFRVSTIQKGGKAFITVRVLQWMNDLPVKTFRKGSICLLAVLDCILFMVFSHACFLLCGSGLSCFNISAISLFILKMSVLSWNIRYRKGVAG